MKDEHLQKYKKIIGKSNGKDYMIELQQTLIHFTIIDKPTYTQRYCLLTSDQLAKMEILSNDLKKPDNLMSYFAAIKQEGKYQFIEVLPNQNILINIRSRKMQTFSVTLQTKARQRSNKITLDSQVLTHMIELVVEEKINIYKKEYATQISNQIKEISKKDIDEVKSPKPSQFKTRIMLILIFVLVSYIIMNQGSSTSVQQELRQLKKQIVSIRQEINKFTQQVQKLKQHNFITFGKLYSNISSFQQSYQQQFNKISKDIQETKQFQTTLKMKLRLMDQEINQVMAKINSFQGNQGGGNRHRYGRHV